MPEGEHGRNWLKVTVTEPGVESLKEGTGRDKRVWRDNQRVIGDHWILDFAPKTMLSL